MGNFHEHQVAVMTVWVVQPLVYRFDDEEWDNVVVKDADWSRQETEYLLDLCEQFQLRFLIIADRYEVRKHSSQTAMIIADHI